VIGGSNTQAAETEGAAARLNFSAGQPPPFRVLYSTAVMPA